HTNLKFVIQPTNRLGLPSTLAFLELCFLIRTEIQEDAAMIRYLLGLVLFAGVATLALFGTVQTGAQPLQSAALQQSHEMNIKNESTDASGVANGKVDTLVMARKSGQ